MSTTTQSLKYLWTAVFDDGRVIEQPADDRYSKHLDTAEWNPSAFRDVLDYSEEHNLATFVLKDVTDGYAEYGIDLGDGMFWTWNPEGSLEFSLEDEPLTERKIIFFREMYQQQELGKEAGEPFVNRYVIGYEGKDSKGKVQKKVIYING